MFGINMWFSRESLYGLPSLVGGSSSWELKLQCICSTRGYLIANHWWTESAILAGAFIDAVEKPIAKYLSRKGEHD